MTPMKVPKRNKTFILSMDLQCADQSSYIPRKKMMERWVKATIATQDLEQSELELVLRISKN